MSSKSISSKGRPESFRVPVVGADHFARKGQNLIPHSVALGLIPPQSGRVWSLVKLIRHEKRDCGMDSHCIVAR